MTWPQEILHGERDPRVFHDGSTRNMRLQWTNGTTPTITNQHTQLLTRGHGTWPYHLQSFRGVRSIEVLPSFTPILYFFTLLCVVFVGHGVGLLTNIFQVNDLKTEGLQTCTQV